MRGHSTLDIMLVLTGGAAVYGAGMALGVTTFGVSLPVAGIVAGAVAITYLFGVPLTLNTSLFGYAHLRRWAKNLVQIPFINHVILPGANRVRVADGKAPLRPLPKVPGEIHWRDLTNSVPVSMYAGLAGIAALGYIYGAPALLAVGGAALLHMTVMEIANRFRHPGGESNIFNRFPWVRPGFKVLEEDNPPSALSRAGRFLREYNHALYQIERSLTIENVRDLITLARWIMFDRNRRPTALRVTNALMFWGAFGWGTLGGLFWAANTVMQLGFSAAAILSAVGIYAYVLGALTVRWATTIGFQGMMFQALKRSGDYFANPEATRAYAAGQLTGPTGIRTGDPVETAFLDRVLGDIGYSAEPAPAIRRPRNVTIHYIATEPAELVTKASWSSFLVENRSLCGKIFHVNMTRGGRNYVTSAQGAVDEVRTRIEAWRDRVRATPRTYADCIVLLRGLSADYRQIGDGYLASAIAKFEGSQQGEAAGLDERLGVDFHAHAAKWEEKAVALERVAALEQAGQISSSRAAAVLDAAARYLEEKFSYDIIVNPRTYCYTDPRFYAQLYATVRAALPPTLPSVLDAATATQATTAIRAALANTGRTLGQEIYGRTPRNFNTWLAELQTRSIAQGVAPEDFIATVLLDAVAQPSFGGGTKAGGQDNWYAKVGSVRVVVETSFVSDAAIAAAPREQVSTLMEYSLEDWLAISARLIDDRAAIGDVTIPPCFDRTTVAAIRRELPLTTSRLGLTAGAQVDPQTARAIVADIAANHLASPATDRRHRDQRRVLERLERAAVRHGFTVEQMVREALFVALHPRQAEWVVWDEIDFNGSFDKDYLPSSINELTGEYDDIFRNISAHYFRLQRDEGAVSIPVIQGNQFYASYIQYGPQVDPATYVGPFPIARDAFGRYRLFSAAPLELTINAANIDQKTWYGAIVARTYRRLDALVTHSFSRPQPPTVGDFFDAAFALARRDLDLGVSRADLEIALQARHYHPGQPFNWNAILTPELALEINQRLVNNINEQAIATGLLPGRDLYSAAFNCGTCRLENLVNMFSAHNKPYVMQRNGHILGQVVFAYDPASRRMVPTKYEPRYPNERGPQRSKESREHQHCRIIGSKQLRRLAGGGEQVVYQYQPGAPEDNRAERRRVEVNYPVGGGKFYRDYDPDGAGYYEIRQSGHFKSSLFQVSAPGGAAELDNLERVAQIDRTSVRSFQVPNVGNFVEVGVHIPDVTVDYVRGGTSERLQHPVVHMADKHITEDMKSTYEQALNGFEVRHFPNKM
jgi:hypothetical protein